MSQRESIATLRRFVEPYRVVKGKGFRLKDFDPGDTGGLGSEDKPQAKELLARGVEWLAEEQDKLYAQNRWAVLLVFQAMDAAGKDSTIKHVMSGVNPQGCQVYSFKQPSTEELDHDFLWRTTRCLPERGRIGIFNRSYYEEVLVVRVHPEFLQRQQLPAGARRSARSGTTGSTDIAAFERYLARNGVADPQVLPQRVAQGAEAAVPGAARPAGEELEILGGRRQGARALERLHAGLRRGDPRAPPRSTRRGTSCRPTTSGTRGSSSPRRSSKRWSGWTSPTRRWTLRSGKELVAARAMLARE